MSRKVRLNYVVDAVIALAFLLSAVSGLALELGGSGGYQGGRNLRFQAALLGFHHMWSDLHVWASLVMIGGVVIHLALHWNWIVCTTKRWLRTRPAAEPEMCPIE